MSYTLTNTARAIPMPPGRRAVLLELADMANHAGICWPSISTLARRACVSVRSVFTHLAELVKAGLLTRRQRIGRSNVFTLALPTDGPAVAPDQPTSAPVTEAMQTAAPAQKSAPAPAVLTVGSVVQAMREAGMLGAYDCTPLAALVTTATEGVSEFTSVAAEAVSKGKGFPWVLTVVKARRADRAQADTARTTVPSKPGRDPVLAQIEADAAQATPPPQSIRDRLAALRASIVGGSGSA
jgi:hypothetical protein